MKKRFAQYVRSNEDRAPFVGAIMLFVSAAVLGCYDLVTIIRGTVDANVHIPFLVAGALAAFGWMILVILRHTTSDRTDGTHDPSSYVHPDHWPHDRINAPDGTSD